MPPDGTTDGGRQRARFLLVGRDLEQCARIRDAAAAIDRRVIQAADLKTAAVMLEEATPIGAVILLAGAPPAGLPSAAEVAPVAVGQSAVLVVDDIDADSAAALRSCGVNRILRRRCESGGEDATGDAWIGALIQLADRLAHSTALLPNVRRLGDDDVELRRLIDVSGAGVMMVDLDHRIVAANQAVERMLGYADTGLVGRTYTDLLHEGERSDYLDRRRILARGELPPHPVERRYYRRNGSVMNGIVNLTCRPVGSEGNQLIILVVQDVSDLRRSERALARSEQRLREAESIAGIAHWEQHGLDQPLICSDAVHHLFALDSSAEIRPDHLMALVVEEDRQEIARLFNTFGVERDLEFRIRDGAGAERHLSCQVRRLDAEPLDAETLDAPAGAGGGPGNFCIVHDITQRKLAELSLEKERNFVSTVLDSEAVLLMVLDPAGHVVRWNKALGDLSGYRFAEVEGLRIQDFLLPPHESDTATVKLNRLVAAGQPTTDETLILQKDGGVRIIAWSNTLVKNAEGTVEYIVATGIDVTERKRAEAVIRHQANYDSLTGLPNRTLFQDRLTQAIATARRTGSRFALLYLDLDRFKSINDTLGHRAGDQLLVEAARRLETGVRETDTVARLGGDEFTVLVYDLTRPGESEAVARKVLERLAAPYAIGRREEFVTCSIGITMFPDDGDCSEALLRNADLAMYRAKEAGRNGYIRFDAQMNVTAVRRKELERELRQAVDEHSLSLAFQPIVSADSGQIVSVEALLRWEHPDHGNIRPDIFIPIAEETGLIAPLGEWVLRTACATAKSWHQAGLPKIGIAVNVSTLQFHQADFPGLVADALSRTGLAADRLTLEITESLMMEDIQIATEQLSILRNAGVHISVDDFGTGYSSLSYLKRLPVDALKVDRSFIMGLPDDEEDAGLVRAVIAMAHGFHIPVVAEGVETEEQLGFLKRLGCDFAQGYLFGKPMTATAIADRLAQDKVTAVTPLARATA